MPKKSKVVRLPPEQRRFVEKLLRDESLTLDEVFARARAKFPDIDTSRSGIGRYKQQVDELTTRLREFDQAARVVIGEFGEGIGEKATDLLASSVGTLVTGMALRAQTDPDISIDDARKLARAAKDSMDAKRMSLAARKSIQQEAREALQREQRAKLDELGKSGAVDPAVLAQIIKAAYDL